MDTLYFSLQSPHNYFVVAHETKKTPSPLLKQGVLEGFSDLNDLQGNYQRLVGILPGELVSIYQLSLPIRSKKQALQALPFALEDQLAAPINEVEFILLDWHPQETSTVAVIDKQLWQSYFQNLEAEGIVLDQIVPDFSLLPVPTDTAAVIFKEQESSRILIRQKQNGLDTGLVLNEAELIFWLDEFDAQGLKIVCNDEHIFTQLSKQTELNTSIEYSDELSDGSLQSCVALSENLIKSRLLLHSENQSKRTMGKIKPWLITSAAILFLSFLSFIGANSYEGYLLSKQNQELDDKIAAIFQENFPQVERVVDAKLQFQRELDQLKGNARGSQEFLYLLHEVITTLPRNTMKVTELHYRESALDVVLTMKGFEMLDKFTNILQQKNTVEFKRLSSDSQGGRVLAKFRFSTKEQGSENE